MASLVYATACFILLFGLSVSESDNEAKIVVPMKNALPDTEEPPRPAVLQALEGLNVTKVQWGEWGRVQYCNPGHKAYGFAMKLESDQGLGDDTALNGVALACTDGVAITSTFGDWGKWTKYQYCKGGAYVTSFQMRIQPPQGDLIDDTGANDINMFCSNGQYIYGNGMKWGAWNQWSQVCTRGICGISTLVLPNQGYGDDVGLNDVAMYCC